MPTASTTRLMRASWFRPLGVRRYKVPPTGHPLRRPHEAEKDEWDALDWGDDGEVPDSVSSEELNKFLFNEDTVDKVLATLMDKGTRSPRGSTGQDHYLRQEHGARGVHPAAIRRPIPEHAGVFARVITHA